MTLKTIANVKSNYGPKLNIIKTEETESPLPGIIPFDPEIQYWFSVRNLKSILGIKHFAPMYTFISSNKINAQVFFPFLDNSYYIILSDLINILNKFKLYIKGKNWLLVDVIPNLDKFKYINEKELYKKWIKNEWPN